MFVVAIDQVVRRLQHEVTGHGAIVYVALYVPVWGAWYFNAKKSPHLAVALYYDVNSETRDTTFKQSNPLTLEGGFGANYGGKTFAGWAGIIGCAQWDVTHTTYRVTTPVPRSLALPLARSFGLGPELTTLQGGLTLRYLWEFGARSALQGRVAVVQFAPPIGKQRSL